MKRQPLRSPKPLPHYQRIAGIVEDMIRDRSLRPGDRIPSVRKLSTQHRVSIPTALQAYARLENDGWIESRPKSGFFVRARLADTVPSPAEIITVPRVHHPPDQSPLDSLMADHSNRKLVPLGAAVPSPALLPSRKLAMIMASIARRIPGAGTDYDMAPGHESLRHQLARRSLEWGCSLKAQDFILTVGASEAMAIALQVTCKRGSTVIVESPTYFGLMNTLRKLDLKALPIPVNPDSGIDLQALKKALQKHRAAACVLTPNFHNPTGCLMPEDHRKSAYQLLHKAGVPIIEDDIYGDLPHRGPRPRCLKSLDQDGLVLLCGSFSKTLAPGYRVGYLAAGRWSQKALEWKRATTLCGSTLATLTMAEFLANGGYDRYLRHVRETYRQQVELVRQAAAEHFPEGLRMSRPQGSFLLWCELPRGCNSVRLFHEARKAGISIAPGPLFSTGDHFQHFIRLNCGHPWTPAIREAIATLGRIIHNTR